MITKEDAKKRIRDIYIGECEVVPKYEKVIDEIYDSLDIDIKLSQKLIEKVSNMRCENCKWCYEISNGWLHCKDTTSPCCDVIVHKDFGCVKFERKEDE